MSCALLAALLALQVPAPVREIALPLSLQEEAPDAPRKKPESAFAVLVRISSMNGVLDDDVDLEYADLYDAGFGLAFEYDLLAPLAKGWKIGGYVQAGFDVFGGDAFTDDVGDTLEADPWAMSFLLLGFKVLLAPPKGFFFDARVGFGPVFYGEAEGELTIGGLSGDVRIFDAGAAFAAEIAAHVGYSAPHVWIAGGFAGRVQGEPEEGEDLAFADASGIAVGSFEIEFGVRF